VTSAVYFIAITTGESLGEPEALRWPRMSEKAPNAIGSSTAREQLFDN